MVDVAPPQPASVHGGGCEQYLPIVSQYNWDTRVAMAIMQAESSCKPTAIGYNTNGTNDAGLFQVNSIHVPTIISDQSRFEPSANVQAAYTIYMGSGWKAWSVYNNGRYMQFLRG